MDTGRHLMIWTDLLQESGEGTGEDTDNSKFDVIVAMTITAEKDKKPLYLIYFY
jgi:hypothetical protein